MLLKAISQPIEEDAAEDVDKDSGHKIHGYISTRPFDGFSYYFMLKHAIPGTHIFVELGVVGKGIGKGKGQRASIRPSLAVMFERVHIHTPPGGPDLSPDRRNNRERLTLP